MINLIGFVMILVDKRKAIKGKRRISERNLFIVAIIGGALFMFLAMHTYHHKTKKLKFNLGFPIIAIIQISCFIYIY
ncbi:MAG TPA: DUF1294 domain-containing protein [Pseudogracilibacillus sp.]|nr:DUF1294 domain-containing protein [Pseudogracilibacillus sp.]